MKDNRWFNIKNAAKYIGLSEKTVRALLKRGLRHVRLDTGTILTNKEWIDIFLGSFEVTGNEIDDVVDDVLKDFKL